MVAEHDPDRIAIPVNPAQRFERPRPAVDKVSYQPKAVFDGIELDFFEELAEREIAALYVTDCVGRHRIAAGEQAVFPLGYYRLSRSRPLSSRPLACISHHVARRSG